jgi:hypothetical protein
LHEQLTAGRRIELPELGVLRMTADGEWRFTPSDIADMDTDAYGLLELEMTPLNPEPPAPLHPVTRPPVPPYTPPRPPAPVTEPPVKSRYRVVCWIVLILLLLVVGGYLFRRPILNFIEKSYYTPEEWEYLYDRTTNTEEPATTPPPAPVTTPEEAVKPEPVRKEPTPRPVYNKEKTRRYNVFHIFVAQFNNEEKAKTYAQYLKDNANFSAMVIHTGGNVYKVSVLRYTSRQDAEELLSGLKSTDSSEFRNAWVEKY